MNSNLSINQNFLRNKEIVSKLIKKADLKKDDVILDIGVGEGVITEELLKNGYEVIGFELDKNLFQDFQIKTHNSKLKILNSDFLTYNLQKEITKPYSVFSNIPFNQTTKIVQKLLIEEALANEVYLIMQEEAANRFIGKKEGLLQSLLILNNYKSEIIYKFKKNDFFPVPKVNTVLVRFSKRENPLVINEQQVKFLDFICYIIMQQKPSIMDRLSKTHNYFTIKNLLNELKINPFSSLYEIPKEKYFELFNLFNQKYVSKFEIFKGSYQKYLQINLKNKKVHQTRTK